jgi:hypothetical protein
MGSIPKGIKNSCDIIGDGFMHTPSVLCRDGHILRETTISIYTNSNSIGAEMMFAGATCSASTAPYMAFCRNALSDFIVLYRSTLIGNLANKFMTYNLTDMDCMLRPSVPFPYMNIGATYCRFLDFYQQIVISNMGYRDFFHPESWFGVPFDKRFHIAPFLTLRICFP